MTTNVDQQVKAAYEQGNKTPKFIADDLGFTEESIKAKLMQISPVYRKACGAENIEKDELNFSDEQLRNVNETIYGLALSAEDEHLRFKAATYVRDDKKGRKEIVRAVANNTFNLIQFNEALEAARNGANRMKELINGNKAIEV
jgi:hypothetical protein